MPDFNKVLEPGNYNEGLVNVVIDIPKGSTLKIEYDRERACFFVDRVDPSIYPQPESYGFIPQTLDQDGDELDVLVVTTEPIPTGVWLEARVIGVMKFEDGGEVDDKIICVPADERNTDNRIKSLADLGSRWQQQMTEHFSHYKDLKSPGTTIVKGWGDIEEAKAVIKDCIERYNTK